MSGWNTFHLSPQSHGDGLLFFLLSLREMAFSFSSSVSERWSSLFLLQSQGDDLLFFFFSLREIRFFLLRLMEMAALFPPQSHGDGFSFSSSVSGRFVFSSSVSRRFVFSSSVSGRRPSLFPPQSQGDSLFPPPQDDGHSPQSQDGGPSDHSQDGGLFLLYLSS